MLCFDVGYAFVSAGVLGWRSGGARPELALGYVGLGVLPAGLAFLEVYPDWDWQYLVDPAQLPPGVPAAFAAAVIVAGFAGHRLGARSVRGLVGAGVVLALFGLLTLDRTLYVGDLAAWQAGRAPLLPGHWLRFAAPWMAGSGAWFALCYHLAGRARGPEP